MESLFFLGATSRDGCFARGACAALAASSRSRSCRAARACAHAPELATEPQLRAPAARDAVRRVAGRSARTRSALADRPAVAQAACTTGSACSARASSAAATTSEADGDGFFLSPARQDRPAARSSRPRCAGCSSRRRAGSNEFQGKRRSAAQTRTRCAAFPRASCSCAAALGARPGAAAGHALPDAGGSS